MKRMNKSQAVSRSIEIYVFRDERGGCGNEIENFLGCRFRGVHVGPFQSSQLSPLALPGLNNVTTRTARAIFFCRILPCKLKFLEVSTLSCESTK
jgi:hypothetical protein